MLKGCVHRASAYGKKHREFWEKAALTRLKDLVDRVELNRLRRAMDNGAWLTAIPHCLNGTELSMEEFQENIFIQYVIVPLNLPTDCDGCGKKFLVPHAFSCPKGGLDLVRHNDAKKRVPFRSGP